MGSKFALKGSLRVSQADLGGSPGSPQGPQRRLQAASVTPVWLRQAPLVSLWLPLGTAEVPPRAIFGAWGRQSQVLDGLGTQISIQNQGFVSHVSNIY